MSEKRQPSLRSCTKQEIYTKDKGFNIPALLILLSFVQCKRSIAWFVGPKKLVPHFNFLAIKIGFPDGIVKTWPEFVSSYFARIPTCRFNFHMYLSQASFTFPCLLPMLMDWSVVTGWSHDRHGFWARCPKDPGAPSGNQFQTWYRGCWGSRQTARSHGQGQIPTGNQLLHQ